MSKQNIGIVSVWFSRGAGYIATQIRDAFKWHRDKNSSIHILARKSVTDNKERFDFSGDFYHNSILYYPNYVVDSQDFKRWLRYNKISSVIFVEELFTKNLIQICKEEKVKAYNYIVWENVNPAELDYFRLFDGIICPTFCSYDYLKKAGLINIHYIKWGVNLDIFTYKPLLPFDNRKIKFFFLNGWGGVYNRKNQEAVLNAFSVVTPRMKAVLDIHSQKEDRLESNFNNTISKSIGDMDRASLNKRLAESDISLIPSRWEGNGLPFYETFAVGRPVITVDYPPMNEHVQHGINGLVCKVDELKDFPKIFVKSAEIDIKDFIEKMILLSENKDLLYNMSINSRKYVEENFDWKINSKKLVGLI